MRVELQKRPLPASPERRGVEDLAQFRGFSWFRGEENLVGVQVKEKEFKT